MVLIGAERKTMFKKCHKKHRSVCSFFLLDSLKDMKFDEI